MSTHTHTFCLSWLNRGEITGSTEFDRKEVSESESEDDIDDLEEEVEVEDADAEETREKKDLNKIDDSSEDEDENEEDNEEKKQDEDDDPTALNSDEETIKRFNLDDYDDSDEDEQSKLKFEQLCHESITDVKTLIESNSEDKKNKNLSSKNLQKIDEDNEEIISTDNLLIAGRSDGDFNSLEIHVYNTTTGDFYCHHDIWIEQTPLCMEILRNSASVFALLGLPDGSIEAWDLAVSNVANPDLKIVKSGSDLAHSDAVLAIQILNVENDKNTYFVSSSVDKSVKVWKIPVVEAEDENNDVDDQENSKESYSIISEIKDLKSPIQSIDINSNKTRIVFGTISGIVRLHRLDLSNKNVNLPEKAKKKFTFISKLEESNASEEVEKVKFHKNPKSDDVEDEFIIAAGSKGTINIFTGMFFW